MTIGNSFDKPVIAMTGDRDYLYPLGVAISSLALNSPVPLHLDFALPRDWSLMISRSDLHLIRNLVESLEWTFEVIECAIDASQLPRTRHISAMTFMKPAYFDISERTQVAFVDGDLIAVDDWSELLDRMPALSIIQAGREDNMQDFERKWAPDLESGWYFNAGVLKVQPQLWQQVCSRRWRELLEEFDHHGFTLLEQDIMNATLLGSAGTISPGLNCRPAYGHSLRSARIVHYAGWHKPWLMVPGELRCLSLEERHAFRLFKEAELRFISHVEQSQGRATRRQWVKAKQDLRGRLGWRAHTRFLRWRWAQRVRALHSNLTGHTPEFSG